ncbi:hypothetical protein EIN_250630 [Entamoeba invadens IP1]|uniref:TLDc domain-containing protein n=1 Tax=Entamoeba invadens IP1 TaxID=370355 RepID=A0A0A1UGI8_ENTIV|nr:hypothetical protein EIN_250630 [Entamoeba invadens IP1]ELP94949.1 hypothetical protein EIN_250630 [Entamoeba invadens IP1]|eukprot:XP_004261720.1 hypothetical protein EIN_250630 [Entamoeba invadens IP1]
MGNVQNKYRVYDKSLTPTFTDSLHYEDLGKLQVKSFTKSHKKIRTGSLKSKKSSTPKNLSCSTQFQSDFDSSFSVPVFNKVSLSTGLSAPLKHGSPYSSLSGSPRTFMDNNTQDEIQLIPKLSAITKKENYNIIYNSAVDELSSRNFNSKVYGKSDVTVIVTLVDGQSFGCYQEEVMSFMDNSTNKKFYIFNTFLMNKIRRHRVISAPETTLHLNTEKNLVFTCNGAFWITSENLVYFHPAMDKVFNIPSKTNPICINSFFKPLKIRSVVAMNWF